MECKEINDLILKFMESKITFEENVVLQNHLKICQNCREDFALYTQMLDEFLDNENLIKAPDNFEQEVMQKIEKINPKYIEIKNRVKSFNVSIMMSCILLYFLNFIISFNKDNVLLLFDENSALYKIAKFDEYVEILKTSFHTFLVETFNLIYNNLDAFDNNLKIVSCIFIVVFSLAQFKNYKLIKQ